MNKNDLLKISPIPCKFKLGDKVKYTNDYGVEWIMVVIGFSTDLMKHNMFIHTDFPEGSHHGAAWWCPKRENSLEIA